MSRIGTPLQVLKYSRTMHEVDASDFIDGWLKSAPWAADQVKFDAEFAVFCELNPDEPERGDGRKAHYGSGRQPLDDIFDLGWGPQFCAGNIIKYMRRDKEVADSRVKARWYFRYLRDSAAKHPSLHVRHICQNVIVHLNEFMTPDELIWLKE